MTTAARLRLAPRVESLKPSATLEVGARAKALRAQGIDVLSFAAGEPDFPTPEPIRRAACDALDRGLTGYGPVPGDAACREAIAAKLRSENALSGVTADHVVVSSGGKQSLYNLMQALLQPGVVEDGTPEVIIPVPAWVSYRPQVELAGGTVVEVLTTADSGFRMSPEDLRAAITPRTRMLILNSPSNPCGTMYSPEELRAVGAVVAEAIDTVAPQLVVISDEIYEKLIYGDAPHFSIGSIPEIAERVVTVNGLSKCFSMTGWRIGYFAGSGDTGLAIAGAVKKLQSQSTTSIPTFLMPAIVTALTECADDVERMRATFAERGAIMFAGLDAIPGVQCPQPTGAMYCFPDVSAHFGTTSSSGRTIGSALEFAGALLDEQHVACVPGEDFGTGGERCCRFSFACADDAIRSGIERVAAFVHGLR